jgi:hypothetical protein
LIGYYFHIDIIIGMVSASAHRSIVSNQQVNTSKETTAERDIREKVVNLRENLVVNLRENLMRQLVLVVFLTIATLGSTSSFATTCDSNQLTGFGLVGGSFPCFETAVQVKLRQAHDHVPLTITGIYDRGGISLFYKSATEYLPISDTIFRFSAAVDGPGPNSWNGSMSIRGHIDLDGLMTGAPQLLMSADLTGEYAQNGSLIGFNTQNIVCNAAIDAYIGGSGCTENEVIYFALNGTIDLDGKNQNFTGTAYTSVPLPAAVWLFGSGLLGLMGIAGGRKIAA